MSRPDEPDAPVPDYPLGPPESPEAVPAIPGSTDAGPDSQAPAQIPDSLATDPLVSDVSVAGEEAAPENFPALPSASEPAPDTGTPSPASPPAPALVQNALEIVEVEDLDWPSLRRAANPSAIRANMRSVVERMETLLDRADGPGMLFDGDRSGPDDRVIQVSAIDTARPLWIIGDLHGDLLALEAALAAVQRASPSGEAAPRIVFMGDLFDDEGFGLEVLLRVFELITNAPDCICVLAGNHDEALSYDGVRFASSVMPSDFTDFLNANLTHEWIERAGKLAVRLFARAPRALFFPDGLLVAHGGFPLADLHPRLAETGEWNDPMCLSDFVWARAHPKARRKLPNRFSRGSQFGYEDFAEFCLLSASLGRPVTHMVRGHDHVEERYATYPAYRAFPILTIVALSRRLSRESFGPYERAPTVAQFVEGALPRVHRLHIPADMIREIYPEPNPDGLDCDTIQEPHK